MRASLRHIHSPDVDDLRSWAPDGDFGVLLQLMVGPDGSEGEESFDVTLCTAAWLGEQAIREGIFDCRHHFVVSEYDYDAVERFFKGKVAACEAATWPAVAARVARLGRWEFEDYQA